MMTKEAGKREPWGPGKQAWSNQKLTDTVKKLTEFVCAAYKVNTLEQLEVGEDGDVSVKPIEDEEKG